MAYELYYWGACGEFYGRALSPLLIFEESGASSISSFTAAVDESELPDGLGKWWNRMLKTKAVAALKGKGKKLMPGEHNKAW